MFKRRLSDVRSNTDPCFKDNLYFVEAHGHSLGLQTVNLKSDESVIMVCNDGKKFMHDTCMQGWDMAIKTVKQQNPRDNYLNAILGSEHYRQRLCVFTEYAPDLALSFQHKIGRAHV